jgi:hypothetical protein
MIQASTPELRLHFALLESSKNALAQLTDLYSEHLLSCLNKWYGNSLYDDPSLAYEAVYESLRHYTEHPRKYNPEHSCLVRFLELNADRIMQEIFERENYSVNSDSLDHYLARYFDNELDFQLAKIILNNKADIPAFVYLLDIGSYRIAEQLSEIKRHTDRINNILASSPKKQTAVVKKQKTTKRINGNKREITKLSMAS